MGLADDKLRVFCAVAETGSFSKASEIVNLTQPAVSIQIQAFEEEYGTRLFDRTGEINLTPAGEIFYRRAKELLALYSLAGREISEITGVVKGSMRIGATTTFGNHILPAIIAEFRRAYQRIAITVIVGNTLSIMELLQTGAVDFAIVGEAPLSQDIISEHIIADELAAIAHPGHPLAGRESVSIIEVLESPIVMREKGSATRKVVEDFLHDNGIDISDLRITSILSCTSSIKEAVEKKMGISFMSVCAVREELKNGALKKLTLKEGRIIRSFSLAVLSRAILSHASVKFIGQLKSFSRSSVRNSQVNPAHRERPYPSKSALV